MSDTTDPIPEGISLRLNATLADSDGVPISLASRTAAVIMVRRPDSAALTLTATVVSEAAGTMYGDLTPAQMVGIGEWSYWPEVTYISGAVVSSLAEGFEVVKKGTRRRS